MLKYRHLHRDMIKVFKLAHNYYDSEAAVKLNFNTLSTTRGNMYKLQKFTCHFHLRKYSFRNSLLHYQSSSEALMSLMLDFQPSPPWKTRYCL